MRETEGGGKGKKSRNSWGNESISHEEEEKKHNWPHLSLGHPCSRVCVCVCVCSELLREGEEKTNGAD